eukprot:m.38690 g.38690  ORF g.38690 m.38690 type:complete len:51 (-) comp14660_c0_seq1:2405-2557(-)
MHEYGSLVLTMSSSDVAVVRELSQNIDAIRSKDAQTNLCIHNRKCALEEI